MVQRCKAYKLDYFIYANGIKAEGLEGLEQVACVPQATVVI